MNVYFVINEKQYEYVVGSLPCGAFKPSVIMTDVPHHYKDDSGNRCVRNANLIIPVSDERPVVLDLDTMLSDMLERSGVYKGSVWTYTIKD